MDILVIGSSGMLGHVITIYLREKGYTVTDVSSSHSIDEKTVFIDIIKDDDKLKDLLDRNFDFIINCAALLVKKSEEDKEKAILLNSVFPHKLKRLLDNKKTRIIQVSTDGVFLGNNAPYNENDKVDTNTFYGKTKILGELDDEKNLTIRTSVIGPQINKGIGLFDWFVNQTDVVGYDNVILNGVTTVEFAKFIHMVIENPITGIYHLCAAESISKGKLLEEIKNVFKLKHISVHLQEHKKSDNTLINNRNDFKYSPKNYNLMLQELKDWMITHPKIYSNYEFIRRNYEIDYNC